VGRDLVDQILPHFCLAEHYPQSYATTMELLSEKSGLLNTSSYKITLLGWAQVLFWSLVVLSYGLFANVAFFCTLVFVPLAPKAVYEVNSRIAYVDFL